MFYKIKKELRSFLRFPLDFNYFERIELKSRHKMNVHTLQTTSN